MQICTSLQTDNHASTPPLSFLQAGCPSCRPTNSVKALKGYMEHIILSKVIGENGWQFFSDDKYSYEQISEFDKFRKNESIKICVKFDNGSIT